MRVVGVMPAQILDDNGDIKNVLQIMNAEPSSTPNNNSQQQLMDDPTARNSSITYRQKITVIVLFYVNLINYMDRYTIAGKICFSFCLTWTIKS